MASDPILAIVRRFPQDLINDIAYYSTHNKEAACKIEIEENDYVCYRIEKSNKLKFCKGVYFSPSGSPILYGVDEFLNEDEGCFEYAVAWTPGSFHLDYNKKNNIITYSPICPDNVLPECYFNATHYKKAFDTMIRDMAKRTEQTDES